MSLLLDELLPQMEAWLLAAKCGRSLDEPLPTWSAADWTKIPPEGRVDLATLEIERLLESRRLKQRLSSHPFYGRMAAKRPGDEYWIQRTLSFIP